MAGDQVIDDSIVLSVADAARFLSVSRTAIYTLIGDGSLRTVKIGRRRLVVKASIVALVERLSKEPYGIDSE